MPTLTDGRQEPREPTWHFWVLALLVLPLASIAVFAMFALASDLFLIAEATCIVLSALLLAQERAVRRMPPWRRAVWSVVGGLLVASVDWVILVAFFYYAISAW